MPKKGGPPGSPRWGTQTPLLGTSVVFSEKSTRLGATRAGHEERILMTPRSGRILQRCVKHLVLTEGQRQLPGRNKQNRENSKLTPEEDLKETKARHPKDFPHRLATEPEITPLKIYFCCG